MTEYAMEVLRGYQRHLESLRDFEHPPDSMPTIFVLGDFTPDVNRPFLESALRQNLQHSLDNPAEEVNPDWLSESVDAILKGADIPDKSLPAIYSLLFADSVREALQVRQKTHEEIQKQEGEQDLSRGIIEFCEADLECYRELLLEYLSSEEWESEDERVEQEDWIRYMTLEELYEDAVENRYLDPDIKEEEYLQERKENIFDRVANEVDAGFDGDPFAPYNLSLREWEPSASRLLPTALIAYISILLALDMYRIEFGRDPRDLSTGLLYDASCEPWTDLVVAWYKSRKKSFSDAHIPPEKIFAATLIEVKDWLESQGIACPKTFSGVREIFQMVHAASPLDLDDSLYGELARESKTFSYYRDRCTRTLMALGLLRKSFSQEDIKSMLLGDGGCQDEFFYFHRMHDAPHGYIGSVRADTRIPFLLWKFCPNQGEPNVSEQFPDKDASGFLVHDAIRLVAVQEFLKRTKGDPDRVRSLAAMFCSLNRFFYRSLVRLGGSLRRAKSDKTVPENELVETKVQYDRALQFYQRFASVTLGDRSPPRSGHPIPPVEYSNRINAIVEQIESKEKEYQRAWAEWREKEANQSQAEELSPPEPEPIRDWGDLPRLFAFPHHLISFMAKGLNPKNGGESQTPIEMLDFSGDFSGKGSLESVNYTTCMLDAELGLKFPDDYPNTAKEKIERILGWIVDPEKKPPNLSAKKIPTIWEHAQNALYGLIPFEDGYEVGMSEFIEEAQDDTSGSSYGESDMGSDRIPLALNICHNGHFLLPPYTESQIAAIEKYGDPTDHSLYPLARTPGKPISGAEVLLVTPTALATNFWSGVHRCFYPGQLPLPRNCFLATEPGWLRRICVQSARRLGDDRWANWYASYRGDIRKSTSVTQWGSPDPRALNLLSAALNLCFGRDWSETPDKRAIAVDRLLDYIMWSMGDPRGCEPDWTQKPWSEHDSLHQVLSRLPLWMYLYPANYFGELLSSDISVWEGGIDRGNVSIDIDAARNIRFGFFPNIERDRQMSLALESSGFYAQALATTEEPICAKALFVSWLIYAPHLIYPFEGDRVNASMDAIVGSLSSQYGELLERYEPDWERSLLPIVVLKERSPAQIEGSTNSTIPPRAPIVVNPPGGAKSQHRSVSANKQEQGSTAKTVRANKSQTQRSTRVNNAATSSRSVPTNKAGRSPAPTQIQRSRQEELGPPIGDLKALTPQREAVEIEIGHQEEQLELKRLEFDGE